jgi:hypothetical protein
MNVRFVALIATVAVITTSSGCSGMRNFLFGRGAACGVCPSQGPGYGLPGPELGCGMEPGCGYEPTCGHEPPRFGGLRRGCGLFGGGICRGSDSCGCGANAHPGVTSGYGAFPGVVNDPYMYDGAVIGSEMIGGPYNGYPNTIVGDNFDSRGGQIMSVDPTPRTSTPRN